VYIRRRGQGLLGRAVYHVHMKNTETMWWVVAAWALLAAIMVGLLLGASSARPTWASSAGIRVEASS
jgi:membrane protein YdbS with pleckstrin-like domain